MTRLVFQKWDEKARMWAARLRRHGVDATGIEGSPLKAPVFMLREIVRRRRPDAYVFRYLNDHPGLAKTLLRAFSEMLVVLLAALAGIRILWILHNVDRESLEYWPRITAFRRRMIARRCDAAFVTDPLLVAHARQRFPRLAWQVAPFGIEGSGQDRADAGSDIIAAEIARLRDDLAATAQGPVLIGLCVTAISAKCVHLFRFSELVEEGRKEGCTVGILFVGAFSEDGPLGKRLLEEISGARYARVLDLRLRVDEEALAPHFDFIYRSLADMSVSYSFYRAAAAGKPIVTHASGLGAQLVSRYGVGLISGEPHCERWADFFAGWSPRRWDGFLAERSWAIGAERLAAAVTPPGRSPA